MRHSSNTFYISFHDNIMTNCFGLIHASFRKWFSNRNAPTRAYIDETRQASLAKSYTLVTHA